MLGKQTVKKRKEIIILYVIFSGISILLLVLLQHLVMPKYMSDIPEGAMIEEYYNALKEHDIVFIGDCEVYENFSPIVLWEEYGINSYIRGSAQQLMWQSYYLLEETFKYEKPQAVIFNVLAMQYGQPQSEPYNRMTLDGMRWSMSKLRSIRASMTPDEHFTEYVFPILRYHTRISELTNEDVEYLLSKDTVTINGYLMQTGVKPAVNVPEGRPLGNYQFDDICYEYLDKMRILCEKNGAEFILIKAPSLFPYWYEEWNNQILEYADRYDLTYINFLESINEIPLDFTVDTYDAGLHLNLSGAEKLSRYFGRILTEELGIIKGKASDTATKKYWEKQRTIYDNEQSGK